MISESQSVIIDVAPAEVFRHVEAMENKFPVYSFLESRPFLALRLALIGEPRTGIQILLRGRGYFRERRAKKGFLSVGEFYGPFELIEARPAESYMFRLKTKLGLFDLTAGYLVEQRGKATVLSLVLVSDPNAVQRIYWQLIKPVDRILARKVLAVIKQRLEANKGLAAGS